ncbi:MAG: MBOAT family O-acyltransferase [Eubacterium sp.]
MVFSSLLFLFRFLPIVLLAYYIAPRKCRNLVLFLSSLVFYAWGEPIYVVLILFSTCIDYIAGRTVQYFKEKKKRSGAKAMVVCSAIINLALLGFFKYAEFFLGIVHQVTGLAVPELHLSLPIGISFYTFQTMSYTIDVYRGDAKIQKNFISFGAYVALFPQLIAGPIVRFKDVAEQLDQRKENITQFSRGIFRFVIGLGKKVLIANQVGILWSQIAAMQVEELTTATAWLGALAFTLQIYFDFSGYSDMAIGLGAMFGFTFLENFNYPYESKSITEFWRRWHISLGTWFREYVYIPLGGNRRGVGCQILNLAIVWFLTGLWHGAYYNFVLWGVYYGILLILEKIVLKKVLDKLPAAFGHIYTMLFVIVGWSIFSWQDMADGVGYMRTMFFQSGSGLADQQTMYLLLSHAALIIIGIVGSLSFVKRFLIRVAFPEDTVRREIAAIVLIMVLFVACVALLVNSSYNPFLYFRF